MKRSRLLVAAVTALAAGVALPMISGAQTYNFAFTGPGVSGSLLLSYGSATDAKYPGAYEITGISGTFSDMNGTNNINNASVGPLAALNHDAPTADNTLATADFSKFTVASGLPAQDGTSVSYDNLFWPGGSLAVCTGVPLQGGALDIYGLLFGIGNGQYVNLWSNGDSGNGADYGLAVVTADAASDYVGSGVTTTPEPGSMVLLGTGMAGLVAVRRRRRAA